MRLAENEQGDVRSVRRIIPEAKRMGIGDSLRMRPKLQKRSALKLAGRINDIR